MLKAYVSNGFFQISLCLADTPNFGLIFPVDNGDKPIVATSLTLPMGWKNFPPLLCTATETASNLVNQDLCVHAPSQPHKLDNKEPAVVSAIYPKLSPSLFHMSCDSLLLHTNSQLLAYVYVFINDFIGLVQGPNHQLCHVRRTLFHDLYKVFRSFYNLEPTQRK